MMNSIYLIQCFIGQISSQIVVSAMNPIHRIGYLVIVFLIGAFIFMFLDYYFQGQVYIIVYVGAIAILFQFIIMMVPVWHSPQFTATSLNPIIMNNLSNSSSSSSPSFFIFKYMETNIFRKTATKETASQTYKILQDTPNSSNQGENNNYLNFEQEEKVRTKNPFFWLFMLNENESIFREYIFGIEKIGQTYFYPKWATEYISYVDQETQGIMTYVAYPAAQIQIGLSLWSVMIGIISICSPRKEF